MIGPMPATSSGFESPTTKTFAEFSDRVDYSFMDSLQVDPQATDDGNDHQPRQVFSGHFIPVTPTALPAPEYIAHSNKFFNELVNQLNLVSGIILKVCSQSKH